MNFSFSLIIIPVVIIATAVIGSRYVKQGIDDGWYKHLHKPEWTPKGSLIGSIWTFIYVVTGLAVAWYWNVPAFTWFHYIVGAILLYNAYLNATWNRIFFVEHDIPKALKWMKRLNATTVLATVIILFFSPIAAFLMLPYIIWVYIATRLTKEILQMNEKHT
jgi:translocator protein